MSEGRRAALVVPLLSIALVVACILAVGRGAFAISPQEIAGSILHRLGIDRGPVPDQIGESVLWDIRMPRVALSLLVGSSLGCAGAVMQGTFANPLAEPGIVGVSSGAALGAVASIVLGFTLLDTWSVAVAAFVGGLVTVMGVYAASRSNGRTEVVTLILTGVAVNAMTGAVIGLFTFFSDDAELRSITFWQLGSMSQATWSKVLAVLPLAVIGIAVALSRSRQLDLLALGERSARHLGVDVEWLRLTSMIVVAVLTASAVAVSGIILFVGLVIPHLVRMTIGPSHRLLLPASVLGGALIVVVADLLCRTLAAPREIPLGVLTALAGSPVFFLLLRRTRVRQGGWA